MQLAPKHLTLMKAGFSNNFRDADPPHLEDDGPSEGIFSALPQGFYLDKEDSKKESAMQEALFPRDIHKVKGRMGSGLLLGRIIKFNLKLGRTLRLECMSAPALYDLAHSPESFGAD